MREDLRIRHVERHRRRSEFNDFETYHGSQVGTPLGERLHEQQLLGGDNINILHSETTNSHGFSPTSSIAHNQVQSLPSMINSSLYTPSQLPQTGPAGPAVMGGQVLSPLFPAVASPSFSDQHLAAQVSPQQQTMPPPQSAATASSPLGVSPLSSQVAGSGLSASRTSPSNTTDLINWLFSDGMLSNARDLFLPTSFYSAFESPMDLPTLLTPPTPTQARAMSETKRLDILGLIPSLESHPDMELDAIQRYILLYWERFHFQFPVLHRPTFEADSTPGPLLWSIIMIGAHYGGAHGLALDIAEHLRWVIFGSPGFHPPAKIWIIQSLLFLEVFEKTMSTRKFHERAHIHHATTLQLIRRGSTLIGSSSNSGAGGDNGHGMTGANGIGGGGSMDSSSSEVWKRWIDAEMAKRAAFMAFILDVCHAALFAHSLVLSTHEVRLSLPCDDSAWESIPGDRSHVVRTPTMPFLKALKKLLNQQSVATGRFGSVVLLCGLMSLSYQMEQLDLQISSLGWGAFRDTWRTTLAPALDFWKADYDRRYPIGDGNDNNNGQQLLPYPEDGSYLQRLVPPMWHMAHIAMRVSIYDLEIFCGVHRVMGRPTRHQDFTAAKRRMTDWAISERAPDAAFHAAHGLYEAIVQGDLGSYYQAEGYIAGHDAFVHRAYILAHSAMVMWAYGYCLEGPESNALGERDREAAANGHAPAARSDEEVEQTIAAVEEGRAFLERMCTAATARELGMLRGKSHTVGLLRIVIEALRSSKWQLVHEVCDVLGCCVQRSLGREEANVRGGRQYYDD